METIPDIIMRCPKCLKEFSLEETYCEECTAMLEPVDIQEGFSDEAIIPSDETLIDDAPCDEKLEDAKIRRLKTDIEERFVNTLLLELRLLKDRLSAKEQELAVLTANRTDAGCHEGIRITGKTESHISGLLERTAKIESVLEILGEKTSKDLSVLEREIEQTGKPGLFGYFTGQGSLFRLRSSELRRKKELVRTIGEKVCKRRPPVKKYVLTALGMFVILAAALTFSLTTASRKGIIPPPSPAVSQTSASPSPPSAKEIYRLLEDIRAANMKKDIGLWQSCYSSSYLEQHTRKDEIADQWRKYDYLSLHYRVEDIRILPDKITTVIIWDMELKPLESGKSSVISQRLSSDFVVENGKIKISAVRKAAQ